MPSTNLMRICRRKTQVSFRRSLGLRFQLLLIIHVTLSYEICKSWWLVRISLHNRLIHWDIAYCMFRRKWRSLKVVKTEIRLRLFARSCNIYQNMRIFSAHSCFHRHLHHPFLLLLYNFVLGFNDLIWICSAILTNWRSSNFLMFLTLWVAEHETRLELVPKLLAMLVHILSRQVFTRVFLNVLFLLCY